MAKESQTVNVVSLCTSKASYYSQPFIFTQVLNVKISLSLLSIIEGQYSNTVYISLKI